MADRPDALDEAMDKLVESVEDSERFGMDDATRAARQRVREARCAECRVGSGATGTPVEIDSGLESPVENPATVPPLPADVRALVEEADELLTHLREGRDIDLNVIGVFVSAAAAALRRLAADAERLDWLERVEGRVVHRCISGRQADGADADAEFWQVDVAGEGYTADSLRDAIDGRRGQEGTE